jgi:hypothetical protein
VPVVLDELHDRALVDQRAADVVRLRPRRDQQERQPRPETALALLRRARRGLRHLAGLRAAHAGPGQRVERSLRLGEERAEDAVVPAVGVIPGDDDRRGLPRPQRLEVVDGVGQPGLLVQRIGVADVAVLVGGRLEIRNGGQPARVRGGPEVRGVVLVVRLVGVPDRRHGARRQVHRVGGGGEVLERLVVRDVRGYRRPRSCSAGSRSARWSAACHGRGHTRCRSRPRTSPRCRARW